MDSIPMLALSDLMTAKRVLAIQPHYDDNDIAAGGTLLTLKRAGADIIYLTVTDDLAGVIDRELTDAQALKMLAEDQQQAGAILGVQEQIHLGYPDGGEYSYYRLRSDLIDHIRTIKPDFIFTVDPWMPYEAHQDHIITGKAAAEAAILYAMPAFGNGSIEELDDYACKGVVFYNTAYPNLVFNISSVLDEKHKLLRSYQTQFIPEDLDRLVMQTSFLAAYVAQDESFEYGEALKMVPPWMLHGVPLTMHL
jgi:N,N'-diacetylchitobiose non-reducing end deacetylase